MFWIWLGIVISLSLIEILTVNLTTIWFVISGLVALVVSFFIKSYNIQFGIFVIVGVLLLLFTRSYFLEKLNVKKEKTNLDRVVGMIGIVTEEIKKNKPGEVKVDNKKWTAISNKKIQIDKSVKIKKIDGVKLVVEEVDE